MQPFLELLNRVGAFLNTGIAGSEFTPLKLVIVITLIAALIRVTSRVTRWLVDTVLTRRGFDVGMREALGAIVRYGAVTLGTLVILQSAGINLTSLNVLVGAIGVGLGFGLQNIMSNFFSGLIILFERPARDCRRRHDTRHRRQRCDRGPQLPVHCRTRHEREPPRQADCLRRVISRVTRIRPGARTPRSARGRCATPRRVARTRAAGRVCRGGAGGLHVSEPPKH